MVPEQSGRGRCYRNRREEEGEHGAACRQGGDLEGVAVTGREVIGTEETSQKYRICGPAGEARWEPMGQRQWRADIQTASSLLPLPIRQEGLFPPPLLCDCSDRYVWQK